MCGKPKTKINNKTKLSLGKTRYSLYSFCCSTDHQGYERSMIFYLIWKGLCNFLLVINSKWPYYAPFSHNSKYRRLRSFKVSDSCGIWKSIWDILLVINSNLGPISHRLATIYPWHTDVGRQPCHRRLTQSSSASKTVWMLVRFFKTLYVAWNRRQSN